MRAKVGDWIRFQRDNRLLIAEVLYVRPSASWSRSTEEYVTDTGCIEDDGVLEVRSK